MNYFKDQSGAVYALSDEDIANGGEKYLPNGYISITQAEADAITNPPATLQQVQAAKINELCAACKAQIYAGFQSSALGVTYTYPANDKDQANLSASVLASLLPGIPVDWTTPFWCMDQLGNWAFVPHTAVQIQQVGMDAKNSILTALERNALLSTQVLAATTINDVNLIVW